MTRMIAVIAIAAGGLFLVSNASAQEVLSLEQTLKIAIDQSNTVGIYREQLQTSRQNVLRNYGNFLPDISWRTYAGHSFVGPSPGIFVDAQGRAIDQAGFDYPVYTFGFTSSFTIFNFGVNTASLKGAKQTAVASENDLQYQKDVVTAITIRAYYDLVRRENLRSVQEDGVGAAQRNLEQVEAFFKIGSNTRADVLQAKVRLGNTQLQLITAVNAEENARTNLQTLLNYPLDKPIEVDASLEKITRTEPDFHTEVDYMYDHRSDLIAGQHRVEASEQEIKVSQNSRWPTFAVAMNYGWNQRQFPQRWEVFKENFNWNIGLGIQWSIFDRFQSKSNIINAQAQKRIADYNLQQSKLEAVREVKQLILAMKEADERIRVSEETVDQARENLRLARERYRVGAGTILETIEAEASLTEAQGSLVEAKCDYLIAQADLQRATGRPMKFD